MACPCVLILLPGSQTDVALGQDGIYCIDSRVSELGRTALVESGAYFLLLNVILIILM